MKTLGYIYITLAVLFGAVGIVQCARYGISGTITILHLLNFLPATAFLICFFVSKNIRREGVHFIAIFLCILALVFWAVVTIGVEAIISATTEVINAAKYDEILTDYWSFNKDLVEHFPRPIPSDVNDVRFSFRPAFLQGGAHVQLRYSATSSTILELYERFSTMKTKSFTGGDMNDHINMKEGMPTTSFYTNESDSYEFPEDYEIMIFDKVLKEENRPEGHYWNHGKSHGVAISKKRNEIVYWAEKW